MKKKRILTMGLVIAMTVLTLGSSMTVFAADTGVSIQNAGYVGPTHPGYNSVSYQFEVPAQLLYAMKYDGTLVGGWMQVDNEDYKEYGEIKNHSQLPIQVTAVKFNGNETWNFTDASGNNYVHFVINAKRNDNTVTKTSVLDSSALLKGVDVAEDENFHLFYEKILDKSDVVKITDDGTGVAYKVTHDIKTASSLGTITWTVNGDSVETRP